MAHTLGVSTLVRLLVGIAVVCLSGALIAWHQRTWRRARRPDAASLSGPSSRAGGGSRPDSQPASTGARAAASPFMVNDEQINRYYGRQAIQRTVTSALIGLIGCLLIASHWVRNPNVFAWGLAATVVIVLLVFLSALLDAVRTQLFFRKNDLGFRRARQELLAEYERLKRKEREQSQVSPATDPNSPRQDSTSDS